MKLRLMAFCGALSIAGACVTYGFALIQPSLGWIVGGALLAVFSWAVLSR